jgi:BlaI family penicillinase repressor
MKSKQMLPKPTEVELEILRALWDKGEATVREVFEVVSEQRSLGYTSVLKMLQIMTEKGLVARKEAGKAHIYRAAATQQETQNQLLRDLSQRLFSGSAAQLAMHALALEPASADEIEEIRRMIRQKKEKS